MSLLWLPKQSTPIVWFKQYKCIFLIVLEARSPRSRYYLVQILLRLPSWLEYDCLHIVFLIVFLLYMCALWCLLVWGFLIRT